MTVSTGLALDQTLRDGSQHTIVDNTVTISGSITATNPSVGLDGATAPTSATEIGIIDGSGNLQGVSASNPVPISGSITATNPSVGTDGSTAPTSATEIGIIDGAGKLQGVSASNPAPVTGPLTDTQLRATPVPVSGTVTATGPLTDTQLRATPVPISGAISFTAPQHIIADSGTITTVSTVTAVTAITNALPAGTNVLGHVITDSGSVTNATLSAETTKVIGTVNQGTSPWVVSLASTTITGTVAVTQSTTPWLVSGDSASGASKAGNPVQIGGVFNTTQPTVTTGQTVEAQSTARGAQIVATGADTFNVTVNAALPAGSAVIGHVIADTGSTTAVTGNVTVVQATGTNLHAVLDTTSTTAVTQATATNLNAAVVGTGTAGSPAGNILTIQGVASMTKLLVTPDSVALPANQSVNVAQVAGTNTVTGGVAGIIAVGGNVANAVAATANPVPVGGIFTTTPATLTTGQTATLQFTSAQNVKYDITTIAGTAPTTVGKLDIKGADGDVFVRQATAANLNVTAVLAAGSAVIGHVITDATSVTAATLSAETTKVIGTVRNVGNAGESFDTATGSTVPLNALYIGGVRAATGNLVGLPITIEGDGDDFAINSLVGLAATSAPTLTANKLYHLSLDTSGSLRVIAVPYANRTGIGTQQTPISLTVTETTIIPAGAAGIFNDITTLVITNVLGVGGTVTIKDDTAGTTRFVLDLPAIAGAQVIIPMSPAHPQAVAAKPWTATLGGVTMSINVTAIFVKNK
jgi:hypothetical protein